MATLQVRSIDDQLYKALGRRAAMDNRSISQEVVAILKAYLSSPSLQHSNSTNDFLEMCGTWQDTKNEKQITEEIRESRRSGNRFSGDLF
jgi:plasmid stability protein